MNNHFKRIISALLVVCFIVSTSHFVSAETNDDTKYITVFNVEDSEYTSYKAISINDEIFVSSDDISKILNMEATYCEDSVFYSDTSSSIIDVYFDGGIWKHGIIYEATVHNIDNTYYFPLEKLLYLANAQWCVENNVVYIQLTNNTILDFINAYYGEILDNNVTQTELLMNGESELSNAAKSAFAAVFNDFDVRVFVPIWGAIELTTEDYQNAMLQLAKDELEFIDEYGQNDINSLLNQSNFSEIKSIWDNAQSVADLPEDVLTATDYVNKTYLWIKDTKNGTTMFSEYNDLADFTPAEIKAISDELQGVSDILTIANAIVNVNEIATRSKAWNEDFLEQIELLTDFDETGYDKTMVNYIKRASSSLLEEHEDTFSATTDACVEETLKVLGEELVDLTPAGTLTSIITTSLSVAKLLDEDFATSFDALELSNMVEWLIRIEYVAFMEMVKEIQATQTNSLNGGSTLEELTKLRNTTMLALRVNLRNKVFIYYLNTVRNNDASWIYSDEAKEIEQDILWNYVKIVELSESEPLDRLLVIDGFENMYSDEYGCKRDKISTEILSEEEYIDYSNLVTDAYRLERTESTFVVPKINLKSAKCDEINQEIWSGLYDKYMESNGEINQYVYSTYEWTVKNDILSLMIEYGGFTPAKYYIIYNISLPNGEIVSDDIIIKAAGITAEEYDKRKQDAIGSRFYNENHQFEENFYNSYYIDAYNSCLKRTLSVENLNEAIPFFNKDGQLCVIANLYSTAGADGYYYNINLEDFALVSEYEKEAVLLTHEINISEEEAREIAYKHWNYYEGKVDTTTGFELFVIYDGLLEGKSKSQYYTFRLRWYVTGDDVFGNHLSTIDYAYVNAETGEVTAQMQ